MWLINFLFGRKKKKQEGTQASASLSRQAPGTRISYDPELIVQLKEDHQRLLEIFGLVGKAFANNDMAATARHLDTFRSELMEHLLTENVRFYVYLERTLKQKDQESFDLMYSFRREMNTISKSVLAFFDKYQKNIGKRPKLTASFGKDLENVGAILTERIRREEEILYPLYAPVAAAAPGAATIVA
ncbi:MAG: hemerythrin domain-containing protein [Betaproteobacteria bacterium]|nr:hemerythrin domain-containing protein [Betaproteobacteria bacterium]